MSIGDSDCEKRSDIRVSMHYGADHESAAIDGTVWL